MRWTFQSEVLQFWRSRLIPAIILFVPIKISLTSDWGSYLIMSLIKLKYGPLSLARHATMVTIFIFFNLWYWYFDEMRGHVFVMHLILWAEHGSITSNASLYYRNKMYQPYLFVLLIQFLFFCFSVHLHHRSYLSLYGTTIEHRNDTNQFSPCP